MKTISKCNEIAIVICSHGSNNEKFKSDFISFINRIKKVFLEYNVFYCFIEINSPSIEQCLKQISKNYNKIIFVPTLLFKGKHYTEDIIEKMQELVRKYRIKLLITKGIKLDSELISLSLKKIEKKIDPIKNNLLITISSSSSNSKVMYDLKKYTNKLSRSLKINSSISGFFGNEEDIYKNIDGIISDKNFEKIVLHPLFLFDGFLYQSTKKKFQLKYRKKILIIPPILKNKETFKMFVRKINNQLLLFK